MAKNLRVHISPVGFEFKRVTEPLVRMNADKVYLISFGKEDRASSYLRQIREELYSNYRHIVVEENFINLWDLYECIERFRTIMLDEEGNHVYVNVSTGTKITAIAGMLACMLWHGQPYYAKVSYPIDAQTKHETTEFVEEADVLPVYDIRKPKSEYLLVLDLLLRNGGKMHKSQMIHELENRGIIISEAKSAEEFSLAAKHGQLKGILNPMEKDWNYIKTISSGRRSEVYITDQGKSAVQIFGLQAELGKTLTGNPRLAH